jgi:predicted amidohydrolase
LSDRRGAEALTYAWVHTCAFDEPEAQLQPAEAFPVAALDTAAGPVRAGAMICFDREFPEAARSLALDGAGLILVPTTLESMVMVAPATTLHLRLGRRQVVIFPPEGALRRRAEEDGARGPTRANVVSAAPWSHTGPRVKES